MKEQSKIKSAEQFYDDFNLGYVPHIKSATIYAMEQYALQFKSVSVPIQQPGNLHYKWSKIFAAKRYGGKEMILDAIEQQQLLDEIKALSVPVLPENNWKELRDKFFKECVDNIGHGINNRKFVNKTPHDLFEWIKNNIKFEAVLPIRDEDIEKEA